MFGHHSFPGHCSAAIVGQPAPHAAQTNITAFPSKCKLSLFSLCFIKMKQWFFLLQLKKATVTGLQFAERRYVYLEVRPDQQCSRYCLAGCVRSARSVTSNNQAAIRLGGPSFEVRPLCRASQPNFPIDRALWAWGHEAFHTDGIRRVGRRARDQPLVVCTHLPQAQ